MSKELKARRWNKEGVATYWATDSFWNEWLEFCKLMEDTETNIWFRKKNDE